MMRGKGWIVVLALGVTFGLLVALCRSRCPGLVLQ
jgi:hypothetical protein